MAPASTCSICQARKARRTCPAAGEICAPCCGRDREEAIDCPLDCGFLLESRAHAKPNPLDTALYPDFRPRDGFLEANRNLFLVVAIGLFGAALEADGCNDGDLLDCLDAAVGNRKTRASGLIYDARPQNRIAAGILEKFDLRLREFREESGQWPGYSPPAESRLLDVLMFVRLLAGSHHSGRRRSRAFLHFLYGLAAQQIPEGAPQRS